MEWSRTLPASHSATDQKTPGRDRRHILQRFECSEPPFNATAVRVYFQAACWKRRFHIKETAVSPDEVMSALRRYLENTGDTERAAAVKMGVNRHTLCRWLSEEQSPKKGKIALAAFFLRQAGYL
jgi:hypothetical protein